MKNVSILVTLADKTQLVFESRLMTVERKGSREWHPVHKLPMVTPGKELVYAKADGTVENAGVVEAVIYSPERGRAEL